MTMSQPEKIFDFMDAGNKAPLEQIDFDSMVQCRCCAEEHFLGTVHCNRRGLLPIDSRRIPRATKHGKQKKTS